MINDELICFLNDNLKINLDASTIDLNDMFNKRIELTVSLSLNGCDISKSSVSFDLDIGMTGVQDITAWGDD